MSSSTIQENTKLFFMGTLYTVSIKTVLTSPKIIFYDNIMEINLCNNVTPLPLPFIRRWYREAAVRHLKQRTKFWAKQMALTVNKISIKEQKTRWGSCSSLGNINYNWRIIMAPPEVIDYLVVHELSHRVHMNHSADFWHQVACYAPNHQTCRLWLKEHTAILMNSL